MRAVPAAHLRPWRRRRPHPARRVPPLPSVVPVREAHKLNALFKDWQTPFEIKIYPGALHAFDAPVMPRMFAGHLIGRDPVAADVGP